MSLAIKNIESAKAEAGIVKKDLERILVNSDITAEKLQVVLEKGTFDKKVINERGELIALLS